MSTRPSCRRAGRRRWRARAPACGGRCSSATTWRRCYRAATTATVEVSAVQLLTARALPRVGACSVNRLFSEPDPPNPTLRNPTAPLAPLDPYQALEYIRSMSLFVARSSCSCSQPSSVSSLSQSPVVEREVSAGGRAAHCSTLLLLYHCLIHTADTAVPLDFPSPSSSLLLLYHCSQAKRL